MDSGASGWFLKKLSLFCSYIPCHICVSDVLNMDMGFEDEDEDEDKDKACMIDEEIGNQSTYHRQPMYLQCSKIR